MNAALLAKLIEAGTPAELVAEVALELGRASAEHELLERKREQDRERQRRRRESRDVTECHVTERDERDPSPLEVSPQTPLPKTPNQTSPLSPPILEEKKAAIGACLKRAYPPIDLPDWMPPSYAEFRAMRRGMRNVPFGESAERRVIAKISKLRDEGHDPDKLLSKAIENGHRTVFEDERTKATASAKPLTDEAIRNMERSYVEKGRPDYAAEMRRRYPAAFADVVGKIIKRASTV